jgi:hypothetical protein
LNDLIERAVAAFERGAAADAAAILLPVLDTSVDPRVALLLDEACRKSGDDANLLRAADRLLAIDPAQIRPLIWKGDVLWRGGDRGKAAQFYTTARDRAHRSQIPPTLAVELARIEDLDGRVAGRAHRFS